MLAFGFSVKHSTAASRIASRFRMESRRGARTVVSLTT
jgi:hypothetical protein